LQPLNRRTARLVNAPPVKVLQFGAGNFLRGFADWMIDIMNEKTAFNASVQIFQSYQKGGADLINNQDGLYNVVLVDQKDGIPTSEVRLISCIINALNPHENYKAFLACGLNPDVKFVISNTTEAGIVFEPEDYPEKNCPQTFPGKATALLFHRFKNFNGAAEKGIIFLPCELIKNNGLQLKQTILQYSDHWNLPVEFREWILNHQIFCNTLVDRIVPGFPNDSIKEIQKEIGYEDELVVMAEKFCLWVIEAPEDVANFFPATQAKLNVKFVSDLTPYHLRKVRILNGAHTAMVPLAYLMGLRTVKEAVEDTFINDFLKKAINEEIIPTLDLPKDELKDYAEDVLKRFFNPGIKHELKSIALNSISKFKVRVLPTILEFMKLSGKLPENLILAFAALLIFYKGNWKGHDIPINDDLKIMDFFRSVWQENDLKIIVNKVLSNNQLWDEDLTLVQGLEDHVFNAAEKLLLS
jgi:tagaturonate reductase